MTTVYGSRWQELGNGTWLDDEHENVTAWEPLVSTTGRHVLPAKPPCPQSKGSGQSRGVVVRRITCERLHSGRKAGRTTLTTSPSQVDPVYNVDVTQYVGSPFTPMSSFVTASVANGWLLSNVKPYFSKKTGRNPFWER